MVTDEFTRDFETVDLQDVSRHFGRHRALARTRLTFRAGEVAGLFGPNGAGKSTLLGILSTLVRPTTGQVRYGGRPADDWGDPLRAKIGMLGHDLFLYAELTARENLRFFGQLYGVRDLDQRVSDALAAARLDHRGNDRVSAFSRGLRQRLALERALLHRPRLVLLDEPFTGLDDESTAALIGRLKQLRDEGAVVVMATHDFDSAADVVDRMICLRAGVAREVPDGGLPLRERYRAAMAEAWS